MWHSVKVVVTSKAFKHAVALILIVIAEVLTFGTEKGRMPRE